MSQSSRTAKDHPFETVFDFIFRASVLSLLVSGCTVDRSSSSGTAAPGSAAVATDAAVPDLSELLPASQRARALVDHLRMAFVVQLPDPRDSLHARSIPTPLLGSPETRGYTDAGDGEHVSPHTEVVRHFSKSRLPTVLLPKTAEGALVLSRESTSRTDLAVRLMDSLPSQVEFADGFAVYSAAHASGADIIVRHTSSGPEDFFYFASAPQKKTIEYQVTLGPDVAGLRLLSNTLEFLDRAGTPLWRMNAPSVVDSEKATTAAITSLPDCHYDSSPNPPWDRPVTSPGASVCTVRISLPPNGIAYPALLDPQWSSSSNITARYLHTATAINSRILLAGGVGATGAAIAACDLYDPLTNTTSVAPSMNTPRYQATSVYLPAQNAVLAAGGRNTSGSIFATAEVYAYSVTTQQWGWTLTANSMNLQRFGDTAVYLPTTGNVLLCGGVWAYTGANTTNTCELYNPSTAMWATGSNVPPSMAYARYYYTANLVNNGSQVLIVGGEGNNSDPTPPKSAELYNVPISGTGNSWTPAGTLVKGRYAHSSVELPDGRVIIVGGGDPVNGGNVATSQLYTFNSNPGNSWGPELTYATQGRFIMLAALAADGTAIVTGGAYDYGPGYNSTAYVTETDLFDPVNGWRQSGSMQTARSFGTLTQVVTASGRHIYLAAGGLNANGAVATTETLTFDGNCTYDSDCDSGFCSYPDGGTSGTCSTSPCTANWQCAPTEFCSAGQCIARTSNGRTCASGASCSTGYCVNNICCSVASCGSCGRCDGAGAAAGVCTAVAAGTPCGNNLVCNGSLSTCPSSCASDSDCAKGYFCVSGTCTAAKALGQPCSTADQCSSGFCAQGYCCNTLCDGGGLSGGNVTSCEACNLPGSLGTCTLQSTGPCAGDHLPVDPSAVATANTPGVATAAGAASSFLYGASGIQTSLPDQNGQTFPLSQSVIDPRRAAVLRGLVQSSGGLPLPGVVVTVLGHPEYGQTISRTDGAFDMAVNGGGLLTVAFSATGFVPVQRQVMAPDQAYVVVPTVTLLPYSSATTTVNLDGNAHSVNGAAPGGDGNPRTTNLFFPAGASAQLTYDTALSCTTFCQNTGLGTCSGATCNPSRLTMHTPLEFTQSTDDSPMPGTLPATSGYTFAVDISADEQINPHVQSLSFAGSLSTFPIVYTDNFLGLPQQTTNTTPPQVPVPTGFYDYTAGVWRASSAGPGQIVAILSVGNGLANVDTTGAGSADNSGLSTAERQQLATWYSSRVGGACTQNSQCAPGAGKCVNGTCAYTLWRTPLPHFSGWDMNWGIFPPADADFCQGSPNVAQSTDDPIECKGSIIECQNQVLGESLPIAGTRFTLNYRSNRVPDFVSNRTIQIPLKQSVPASVQQIKVEVQILGRSFAWSWDVAKAPSTQQFTWDGNDAYGRPFYGTTQASVRVGYVYKATYAYTSKFGYNGGGEITVSTAPPGAPAGVGAIPTHQLLTLWTPWRQVDLTYWDSRGVGLGGWDLNVHHVYDPAGKVLYLGDGHRRSNPTRAGIITTVDGGPGNSGPFPYNIYGVAAAADGSVFAISAGGNVEPFRAVFISSTSMETIRSISTTLISPARFHLAS